NDVSSFALSQTPELIVSEQPVESVDSSFFDLCLPQMTALNYHSNTLQVSNDDNVEPTSQNFELDALIYGIPT
ncbi:8253_t:CDS:2, partial [Racocetra fulgida]